MHLVLFAASGTHLAFCSEKHEQLQHMFLLSVTYFLLPEIDTQ